VEAISLTLTTLFTVAFQFQARTQFSLYVICISGYIGYLAIRSPLRFKSQQAFVIAAYLLLVLTAIAMAVIKSAADIEASMRAMWSLQFWFSFLFIATTLINTMFQVWQLGLKLCRRQQKVKALPLDEKKEHGKQQSELESDRSLGAKQVDRSQAPPPTNAVSPYGSRPEPAARIVSHASKISKDGDKLDNSNFAMLEERKDQASNPIVLFGNQALKSRTAVDGFLKTDHGD